jgi:hypothetical protein
MINVLRLSLIGLLFVVFACTQASASGGGRIVQRQRIVQRRQVQRVVVQQQAVYAQPVIQQQVVQKVYAQPIVVQQQVQRVYAQPVIQQQNYCAPALQQSVVAPGCNAFFAH